jgi:hypothetical protein
MKKAVVLAPWYHIPFASISGVNIDKKDTHLLICGIFARRQANRIMFFVEER